jgi:PAS domain S-box-containing protein
MFERLRHWWRNGRGTGSAADEAALSHVQEQLDESRAQLEAVNSALRLYIDRAPLACVAWGPDQIVRAWNPAAVAMFGYTQAEAIGRNIYELTATVNGLAVIDEIKANVQAGVEYPDGVVVENRRQDGSRLRCRWHFAAIDGAAHQGGVIAFGIDVTAKLRAEEARELLEADLRQAQKMQSLGTLAGGIAHDFNNILLAISGNARLAAEDLAPDHPAQLSLAEVSKASARASSIVKQILAFSRREEAAHVPVDLRAIIEDSVQLMRAALPLNVSIRMRIGPRSPIVLGDPALVQQVVVNLATNGAHAIGTQSGWLDIELGELEFGEAWPAANLAAGHYYQLIVRDTGTGMGKDVIDRIFEPFFTTKPRGQGTGLGLSVVHGIVKAHHGAITVESARGEGTTFKVLLPAVEGKRPVTLPAAPSVPQGRGQSILYVDDEEPLVFLITRVLERLGYRVSGFTDPAAAMAAFEACPASYDAVVTDLSMPGMSGADFARRALNVRPHVPIVMTSGYVGPEDRDSAHRSGVRELLLKPNTVEELGLVLHRLLSEARPH